MDARAAPRFIPSWRDPRWPFAFLLTLYCVLGFLFFGFNRTPAQMLFTMLSGCALDVALTRISTKRWLFPLSAWITCASLAIILNYSKGSLLVFVPVLLAIGSKHVLTFDGKHVFNPSMFGVAVSLLAGNELITAAPAYQWAGASITITFFLVTAAAALFIWRIRKGWLIVSFLAFYALNTALRAYIMRHHLPPSMLFIGTMTTPPFYLFALYMITDPATSPSKPWQQVVLAFALSAIDLVLHAKESVYTFFYAALIVATARFVFLHARRIVLNAAPSLRHPPPCPPPSEGEVAGSSEARPSPLGTSPSEGGGQGGGCREAVSLGGPWLRSACTVVVIAVAYIAIVRVVDPTHERDPGFVMECVDVNAAGIGSTMAPEILEQVDPRLQHIAKWILSVGDAVAAGDVDGDGRIDLFFTNPLKKPEDRAALFRNVTEPGGALRFERVPLPELDERVRDPKRFGVPSSALFVDYDGDGDLDLVVTFGFGQLRVLRNDLFETGSPDFTDVTESTGIDEHTVSLGVTFFDFDNDGDLDLLVLNATSPYLRDYDPPRPLNVFDLPQPEYDGDRRMFHFMHNGWHDADNGGGQTLYRNIGGGHFVKVDGKEVGLTSTRWSLAVATADFNHDGFTDLYVANDFGPDELLLNDHGKKFVSIKGSMFNDVGNDTYKGMNASIADFDRNGFLDVTVSNVHHELQAEGSMLWMVSASQNAFVPSFVDEATQRGALNEHRFGWGGAAGDVDNDGWPDIVQANGMVDDRLDAPRFKIPDGERKDYWYVNHKLMQSGPDIHTYADMWGDLRGRTIYPTEKRRAYLNLGDEAPAHFVDVADALGIADPDDSRGVLLADLDNDGDLDVVIANQHAPASLYQSKLRATKPNAAHFVDLVLHGVGDNTRGVGAVVTIRYANVSQMNELHLNGGLGAQENPALHFGLGRYDGDVDVDVRWPRVDGVQTIRVHADTRTDVVEPGAIAAFPTTHARALVTDCEAGANVDGATP